MPSGQPSGLPCLRAYEPRARDGGSKSSQTRVKIVVTLSRAGGVVGVWKRGARIGYRRRRLLSAVRAHGAEALPQAAAQRRAGRGRHAGRLRAAAAVRGPAGGADALGAAAAHRHQHLPLPAPHHAPPARDARRRAVDAHRRHGWRRRGTSGGAGAARPPVRGRVRTRPLQPGQRRHAPGRWLDAGRGGHRERAVRLGGPQAAAHAARAAGDDRRPRRGPRSMNMGDKVSDWLVERLARGELDAATAQNVRARLAAELGGADAVTARLAALAADDQETLRRLPATLMVPKLRLRAEEVARSARAMRSEPKPAPRRRLIWLS